MAGMSHPTASLRRLPVSNPSIYSQQLIPILCSNFSAEVNQPTPNPWIPLIVKIEVMDPLSIVASAIAVFQAADRLGRLCGGTQPFLNAPKDAAALRDEITKVRNALGHG